MTEQRWEEQVLSEVAKQVLSSRMDGGEDLEVEVHTELGKVLQGEASSVSIKGHELAIEQTIHLQSLELEMDHLALNPLSLIFNKLELHKPLQAEARVLLSEADINQALNSEAFCQQLSPLEFSVDGQRATVELRQPMRLQLPDDYRMIFDGQILARIADRTQQVGFTGTLQPRSDQHPVLLETFRFHDGQAMALEFISALMQRMTELMQLPFLQYNGSTFRIKSLEVHQGSLTLQIEADIKPLTADLNP